MGRKLSESLKNLTISAQVASGVLLAYAMEMWLMGRRRMERDERENAGMKGRKKKSWRKKRKRIIVVKLRTRMMKVDEVG